MVIVVAVTVNPAVVDRVPLIVREVRLAVLAFTLTLCPAPIMTISVAEGTIPPGQGAFGVMEFHDPDPAVVIVADKALLALTIIRKATKNNALLRLLENKVIKVFKLPILV